MDARTSAFFPFLNENSLLDKFDKKSQNCQFKLKFRTSTNSDMLNAKALFTFFCFRPETPFLGKFGPKNQTCPFKLKFGTYNQFHNILRLLDVLPNFPFTTSETMGDYYL